MHAIKTLKCYNCHSEIINLHESEIKRFSGLNFQCECCGHQNLLNSGRFSKGCENDPYLNICSFKNVMNVI